MKRALSLLTALLALAYAAAALADYRNDYLNGRDAAKKGDWEKARTLMQSALRERADPVARARLYGTIPEPYVPHYYLGLANARLGDCRAAVDAFENDASKAVIAGLKELAPVQARELASCRQSLLAQQPDAPPAVAQGKPPAVQPTRTPAGTVPLSTQRIGPAQALLDGLDRSIRGIESKLAKAPLAGSGDARAASRQLATFKQQRDQARANLQDAGRAGDAALLGRVEASARSVESGLAQLDAQVDAAARGLNEAIAARLLEARRNSIGGVLAKLDARSREAGAAGVPAEAPALRAAADQRKALQLAQTASDAASIEAALDRANAALRGLDAAIAAAPKPAPEPLRALARAYLGADYAGAAQWNQLEQIADHRAKAQALLLRAAARWHMYMRGGAQDRSLAASVDTDLRKAKLLDHSLKPDARAFSPKLLERYAAL